MAGEVVERVTGDYWRKFADEVLRPRASMVLGFATKYPTTLHIAAWKQIGCDGTTNIFYSLHDHRVYEKAEKEAKSREDYEKACVMLRQMMEEQKGVEAAFHAAFPSDKPRDSAKELATLDEGMNFLKNPSDEQAEKLLERHKTRREKEFEYYKDKYQLASVDISPQPYTLCNRLWLEARHAKDVISRSYRNPKKQFVTPSIEFWISGKPESMKFDIYCSEAIQPQVEKDPHCKEVFVEEVGIARLYEVGCENGKWANLEAFDMLAFDVRRDDRYEVK